MRTIIILAAAVTVGSAVAYAVLTRDARRDIWDDVHHTF